MFFEIVSRSCTDCGKLSCTDFYPRINDPEKQANRRFYPVINIVDVKLCQKGVFR